MSVNYNNIPIELQRRNSWCVWRYEADDNGKPTKVPYHPLKHKKSSSTDPATWCSFIDACNAVVVAKYYDGIGYYFSPQDEYTGIDLDDPYQTKPDGSLVYPNPEMIVDNHRYIMNVFDSYQELSPSGKGVHIIIKGNVPHGRRRSAVEVYSSARYFTFTGNVIKHSIIKDYNEPLQALWASMAAPKEQGTGYAPLQVGENHSDAEIVDMASRATNGDKFDALWTADASKLSEWYPSQSGNAFDWSRADLALMDILAYFTQNRNQIVRLFKSSALGKRKKAERDNYINYMMNKVFDMMLPPVDFSAITEEFEKAKARQIAAVHNPTASVGALNTPAVANATPVGHEGGKAQPGAGTGVHAAVTPAPDVPHIDGYSSNTFLSHPPTTFLNQIASFIYNSAPRPLWEVALVGAIGMFAGIVGRQYNISGTGLNHYIMLIAHSGKGKEAIATGTSRLMNAVADSPNALAMQHVGPADIASGQALLKFMSANGSKSVFSVTGEFGIKLKQITDDRANGAEIMLRKVLLDLYGKSGAGQSILPTIYSDAKNNTEKVNSPCFTLVGESTPELFYESLDESAVRSGLLPRFTIVEYNGDRARFNPDHHLVPIPPGLIEQLNNLIMTVGEMANTGRVVNIEVDDEANAQLTSLNDYAEWQYARSHNDATRELWNRFHLKIMKLAGVLAVSQNYMMPVVTRFMVDWAASLILTDTHRLLGKFMRGEMGANNEDILKEQIIKQALVNYFNKDNHDVAAEERPYHSAKLIRRSYLQSRVIGSPRFKPIGGKSQNQQFVDQTKNMIDNGFIRVMRSDHVTSHTGITTSAAVFVVVDANWLFSK